MFKIACCMFVLINLGVPTHQPPCAISSTSVCHLINLRVPSSQKVTLCMRGNVAFELPLGVGVPADVLAVNWNCTDCTPSVGASILASSHKPCAPQALLAFALREAGGALREPKQARAAAACILRACEGAVAAGLAVPQDALVALLQALAPPTGLEPQVPPKSLPWS